MIRSNELLKSFLEGIRRAAGAERSALYLPGGSHLAHEPMLVTTGCGEAVGELEDPDRAATLVGKAIGGENATCWSVVEDGGGVLFFAQLATAERFPDGGVETRAGPERRESEAEGAALSLAESAWLGLRFAPGSSAEGVRLAFEEARNLAVAQRLPPHEVLPWLLALVATVASQTRLLVGLLHDPVTRLVGRSELQILLAESLRLARKSGSSIALLLVNPDNFAAVNEQYDRPTGDRVIREIAVRLQRGVRKSDLVGRYGGAVFAVLMGAVKGRNAQSVARTLARRMSAQPYLEERIQLDFSIGVAEPQPGPGGEDIEAALDILHRADRALSTAKMSSRHRVVVWRPQLEREGGEPLDRLRGIFTGDIAKDYRNMLLLWETVAAAATSGFPQLAARVSQGISRSFQSDRLAVVGLDEEGRLELVAASEKSGGSYEQVEVPLEEMLGPQHRSLVERAVASGETVEGSVSAGQPPEARSALAVPLLVGSRCVGALYLEGHSDGLRPDRSDRMFLQALAAQVAVASDRDRLLEHESQRRERDQRQLRAELEQLTTLLGGGELVYRSPQMQELLTSAQRVARTDATLLVTGESGTGKELLARTLHRLSDRRDRPLVVVDCASVAPSLFESELFGHERGAFTGADRRAVGRVGEAGGGTLVLDEIGEVPLEMQSRLLRLVQDKQYTPVGGARPRELNARIIAITNRDLAAAVAAGRFRQDLYYRLNVVQLEVPPLRQRPADVEFLAGHFVELFARQHGRSAARFSKAAVQALERHDWPGNVRELQNRILRAVLLGQGRELDPSVLGFEGDGGNRPAAPAEIAPAPSPDADGLSPWEELRSALVPQVEEALAAGREAVPLARWLADDLVLAAEASARGNNLRAAETLGLAETTFRERLRRARAGRPHGVAART
ncbi:MAG TPA: sigma 54-interacting transcriptional regulator, partial [Thermoanaerobaculia bacterium]|nr:sigma 54-interacting transcriptional regulator [Thermoanaerobaculia bacterium]